MVEDESAGGVWLPFVELQASQAVVLEHMCHSKQAKASDNRASSAESDRRMVADPLALASEVVARPSGMVAVSARDPGSSSWSANGGEGVVVEVVRT